MAKAPPSFQFYPADFVMGCAHLDAQAIGCYLLALCYQWAHGSLPRCANQRARICKLGAAEFGSVWDQIADKFTETEDGRYINERLESVRQQVFALSEKRSTAGRKGGQASASNLLKQNGKQKGSPLKIEDRRLKTDIKKKNRTLEEVPSGLDRDTFRAAWAEWLDHKGSKYTRRSQRHMLTKLGKLGPDRAAAAIQHSLAQGWLSIHEEGNARTNGRAARVEQSAGYSGSVRPGEM